MRSGHLALCAGALAWSCTVSTSVAPPPPDGDEGYYTDEEVDAKLAALEARAGFLATCADGDALVRDQAGWRCTPAPPCPPGFAATTEDTFTVCTRTVGVTSDVMVKAGGSWIDRYELSVCGDGVLGTAPANDTTAAACSTPGVLPQSAITWFQAAALCANAGKHLCTQAEWQVAVAGTADPGASAGAAGECATQASGLRMTALATQCRSRFGAEDMIGNLWEWVADWEQGGRPWQTVDGQSPAPRAGVSAGPWPAGYADDQTYGVNGTVADGVWQPGLPMAPLRGGAYGNGVPAGAYSLNGNHSPSLVSGAVGARCCVRGR